MEPSQSAVRRRKKYIFICAALSFIAIAAVFTVRKMKSQRGTIEKSFVVTRKDIERKIELTGKIVPLSSIVIAAPQAGRILTIAVQEGSVVKVGDPLYSMQLEARGQQDIMQQRSEVRRLEIEVQALTESVNDKRSVRELLATSTLAKEESDLAKLRNELQSAKDRLGVLEDDMGLKRGELRDVSKSGSAVKTVNIRAPQAGIVTLIDKRPGDLIVGSVNAEGGSDRTVMVIADMSQLIVRTRVLEADLRYVTPNLPVKVSLDAYPDTHYDGKITHVGGQGRVDRTAGYTYFDVDIAVSSPDPRALPEMNATVAVVFAKRSNVLSLPVSAVALFPDKAFVMALDKDNKKSKPAQKDVKVGIVSTSDVEIIDGIKEGDEVAEIDFAKLLGENNKKNAM